MTYTEIKAGCEKETTVEARHAFLRQLHPSTRLAWRIMDALIEDERFPAAYWLTLTPDQLDALFHRLRMTVAPYV